MKILCTFFLLSALLGPVNEKEQNYFFDTFGEGNFEEVNKALNKFSQNGDANSEVYVAALKMKKAGMLTNPAKKLSLFKEGKKILHARIDEKPDNLEWRFIRLVLQIKAPSILGYDDNLESDRDFIYENYNAADKNLKKHINEFAEISKYLNQEKF